ncbi:lysophospholipid acyltransferase family protein [Gulosibacter faecalis]|jgi:1-acyl-sn-glycerol-3-phosphate acyltransferase|uniref:Lysophospholipid acyltransferase family protein n=1 Tax=Gulosibacter faecalis TaxID=272240 RepID=A0ABW5UWA9_9MICO|nr:lysophospholipid acyltransferase family protein [Gulosibacter faecalis]
MAQKVRYPDRRRPSLFWVMSALVVPPFNLLTKYEITGTLPPTGTAVIAPNHYSDIDPLITGIAVWRLGRKPRYMAKASLFRVPIVGWFLRKSGQIPVERDRGAARRSNSMGAARELVERQSVVVVYPEGTLTREPDSWPMRGKSGAVRLALESGAPLIPMASWGAQALVPRYERKLHLRWRTPIQVRVGDPIDLSEFAGKHKSRAAVEEATRRLMVEITRLLEEIRDGQAPDELYDPAKHGESEFGLPVSLREQAAAKQGRVRRGRRRSGRESAK